ncbi:glycine radical enzyme, YjjI family [Clostridium acidisoli DSM 12555]|uniref:Glycine radical enzyme, YjjI family n=1 Tax=Clostridium acidisoli DSM 12555 TaxID=1121291 RepID=A0A1W1XIN8_9CLOT|nr:YjjI family glycine radical enzyme [Clostridium acidisoli]SMC23829.1 glycine radical enzyme, YjjI family [Clostridium acidisoli DSM 12555]
MRSQVNDILDVVTSKSSTYQQKLFNLANVAERLVDPKEVLGYTDEEMMYIENNMICDLNEGYAIYRPRYIVPDYNVLLINGCKFLSIEPPKDLDELLDSLLILYSHVPSITSFPVFIGDLDKLMEPFITDDEKDYIKIKRFLNHIDKTIVDSFCHADIGPEKTRAGELILKAVVELQNPTPNMTIRYDKDITPKDFALKAAEACLKVSKPSFSNNKMYNQDVGDHRIVSCYNALPLAGGAYTLPRLRLGTIVKGVKSFDELINDRLPKVTKAMATMIDKRVRFIVEKSNFFESSFLVKEGFIKRENFSAMFGIVGLADAVNYVLKLEGLDEKFGTSKRGDEIGHSILELVDNIANTHEAVYCERTNNRYLMHAQVGADLSEEDKDNTPAHRIRVGEEPILPKHLKQAAPFHKYFTSGTGDLFALDQTYLNHVDAVLDIIEGAFEEGARYITTYLHNTDLVRVTGYLVKKSDVMKVQNGEPVLRDTEIMGFGTNNNAHVFERRVRKDGK